MKKISVLLVTAAPEAGYEASDLDRIIITEDKHITQGLQLSKNGHNVQLHRKHAATVEDLVQGLVEFKPDVLHFIGHGEKGLVVLTNNNDFDVDVVGAETLAKLLEVHKIKLKLAILSCCNSAESAEKLLSVSKYSIGFNGDVGMNASLSFNTTFYRSIAGGNSIGAAFTQTKWVLTAKKEPESDFLKLYCGNGETDPDAFSLIDLKKKSTPKQRKPKLEQEPMFCPTCGKHCAAEAQGKVPLYCEQEEPGFGQIGLSSATRYKHGECTLYKCTNCDEPIVEVWSEQICDEFGEMYAIIPYPLPPATPLTFNRRVPISTRRLLWQADRSFHHKLDAAFIMLAQFMVSEVCKDKKVRQRLEDSDVKRAIAKINKVADSVTFNPQRWHFIEDKILSEVRDMLFWLVASVYKTEMPDILVERKKPRRKQRKPTP